MTYDNLEALQGLRPAARFVQIGRIVVDLATHAVRREDDTLRLTPKAAEVLKVLLRHEGEPVSRELLIDQVWRDLCPSDDVVSKAISELRRVLAQAESAIIETIPRVGYRLLPAVHWLDQDVALSCSEPVDGAAVAARTDVPGADRRPAFTRYALHSALGLLAVLAVVSLWLLGLDGGKAEPTSALTDQASALAQEQLAMAMAGHLSVAVRPFAAGTLSEYLPSVSPDGQWVVFGEWPAPDGVGSRLMIRAVGAESARPLIPDNSERSETTPKWSPDGQAVVFQRVDEAGCQLRWFAPFSGDQREVAECSSGFVDWIDFTPDGRGLLLSRPASPGEAPRLRVLELASGDWHDLNYSRSAEDMDVQGVYSPDGRWLAFRRGAMPISDLYLMPAEGGAARRLTDMRSTIRGMDWLPDSRHLVYASGHGGQMALWLLDTRSGVSNPLGAYGATFPQVARRAGTLVYQQQLQPYNLVRFTLADGEGPEAQAVFPSARADAHPSLSPDGRQLAFVSNRGGRNEIMLGDLGSGEVAHLTRTEEGDVTGPAWSPDGRHLLFSRLLTGGGELLEMEVASRRLRTLPLAVLDPRNARYAADGQQIYFDAEVDGIRQVFRVGRDGGPAEQLSQDGGQRPIPAPDGRHLYLLGAGYALQRLDLQEGQLVRLAGLIGFASQFAWEVDARGVHALRSGSGERGWSLHHWPAAADPTAPPQLRPVQVEGGLMATLLGLSIGREGEYYTTAELNPDVDVMYVEGLGRLLSTEADD